MSEPTIREWARAQGLEVKDRGLIPRHIVEAYKLAHGIGTRYPTVPPKPRIVKSGDCWLLDDGQAVVFHDTWPDALDRAEQICREYRHRAGRWLENHS